MENHTESLTRYVGNFVDELYKSGLMDVVISPGSRSTPLALTFAEHSNISHWVNMDERSAAFFALGMAKQQNRPVALLCTSGTAAANYYPAVVEAYQSRVPLIILTADRPHELRDVGAPQAIDQIKLFGDYVKWFHEMSLPENNPVLLNYVRSNASRALHAATQGNPGPVHLNFPFREPLLPDFTLADIWGDGNNVSHHHYIDGESIIDTNQVDILLSRLSQYKKGLIVCGPQFDSDFPEHIVALANALDIPLLVDPLSQVRAGNFQKTNVIESYDAILKSKKVRDNLRPEFIIRFGAMPVSKPYLLFLKENPEIDHYVVENNEGYREPVGGSTTFIFTEPQSLCQSIVNHAQISFDEKWLELWNKMNHIAKEELLASDQKDTELTEGHLVTYLSDIIPDSSTIYVGNSMPVRDMDTFFMSTDKQIKVLGNRGANGIDGLTSSALGAAAHGERVTLLIGDLSFYHDFNGLLAAMQYNLNITVILVNNNGGGIFSFLPQAKNDSEHFEVLFGTPLHINFEHIINMYNGSYYLSDSVDSFKANLKKSYNHHGLSVIEVQTNRAENVEWHNQKWASVEEHILNCFKG